MLIQSDQCPYKKRSLEHTERRQKCIHTERQPWEKQQGDGHLQAKDENSRFKLAMLISNSPLDIREFLLQNISSRL